MTGNIVECFTYIRAGAMLRMISENEIEHVLPKGLFSMKDHTLQQVNQLHICTPSCGHHSPIISFLNAQGHPCQHPMEVA